MDILDTSAIRGMKKDEIHAIAQRRDVGVSPFSVYEILSHLDEQKQSETPEDAFKRRRGMVAKIQGLKILDDPITQHALDVGAENVTNPTRFEDRNVTNCIIDAVVKASSIDGLDKQVITLTDGSERSFRDIAANTRAALEAEEKRYADDVRRMWEAMQKLSSATAPAGLTDADLWEWLKATMTALANSYERDGVAAGVLLGRVTSSMFTYFGYVFFRLRNYPKDSDGGLVVPANDTEDGLISMHVALLSEDTLVTGDSNTIDAVTGSLDLWKRLGPSQITPTCRVMSMEQYRNMSAAH